MMDNSNDIFESTYFSLKRVLNKTSTLFSVGVVRLRKFLALPYCYFTFVDWKECDRSRFQVFIDFLYIFFWLKYYPENYGYCRLWEKDRKEWKYYYGSNYDAYQHYRLEKSLQKKEYKVLFDNKEISSQICKASHINMAKVIGVLDPDEDYIARLKEILSHTEKDKLIIKPTVGHGGGGVQMLVIEGDEAHLIDRGEKRDLKDFQIAERHLVQEYIEQDKELSTLTSSASIRLITMLTKSGELILISAEINTAVDSNFVSNWSAGGIGIGVDIKTGRLKQTGYDKHGHQYLKHPTSGITFSDYTIPRWKEVCEFALRIQSEFPYYKLLGPDITLSDGVPILYEINSEPDLSSTEQLNGPLLKDKTIREEFLKYDLLINDCIKD